MTGDFTIRYRQRDRMERKRKLRLLRKIQKADALAHAEGIALIPSWNRRFGKVANLRVALKNRAA